MTAAAPTPASDKHTMVWGSEIDSSANQPQPQPQPQPARGYLSLNLSCDGPAHKGSGGEQGKGPAATLMWDRHPDQIPGSDKTSGLPDQTNSCGPQSQSGTSTNSRVLDHATKTVSGSPPPHPPSNDTPPSQVSHRSLEASPTLTKTRPRPRHHHDQIAHNHQLQVLHNQLNWHLHHDKRPDLPRFSQQPTWFHRANFVAPSAHSSPVSHSPSSLSPSSPKSQPQQLESAVRQHRPQVVFLPTALVEKHCAIVHEEVIEPEPDSDAQCKPKTRKKPKSKSKPRLDSDALRHANSLIYTSISPPTSPGVAHSLITAGPGHMESVKTGFLLRRATTNTRSDDGKKWATQPDVNGSDGDTGANTLSRSTTQDPQRALTSVNSKKSHANSNSSSNHPVTPPCNMDNIIEDQDHPAESSSTAAHVTTSGQDVAATNTTIRPGASNTTPMSPKSPGKIKQRIRSLNAHLQSHMHLSHNTQSTPGVAEARPAATSKDVKDNTKKKEKEKSKSAVKTANQSPKVGASLDSERMQKVDRNLSDAAPKSSKMHRNTADTHERERSVEAARLAAIVMNLQYSQQVDESVTGPHKNRHLPYTSHSAATTSTSSANLDVAPFPYSSAAQLNGSGKDKSRRGPKLGLAIGSAAGDARGGSYELQRSQTSIESPLRSPTTPSGDSNIPTTTTTTTTTTPSISGATRARALKARAKLELQYEMIDEFQNPSSRKMAIYSDRAVSKPQPQSPSHHRSHSHSQRISRDKIIEDEYMDHDANSIEDPITLDSALSNNCDALSMTSRGKELREQYTYNPLQVLRNRAVKLSQGRGFGEPMLGLGLHHSSNKPDGAHGPGSSPSGMGIGGEAVNFWSIDVSELVSDFSWRTRYRYLMLDRHGNLLYPEHPYNLERLGRSPSSGGMLHHHHRHQHKSSREENSSAVAPVISSGNSEGSYTSDRDMGPIAPLGTTTHRDTDGKKTSTTSPNLTAARRKLSITAPPLLYQTSFSSSNSNGNSNAGYVGSTPTEPPNSTTTGLGRPGFSQGSTSLNVPVCTTTLSGHDSLGIAVSNNSTFGSKDSVYLNPVVSGASSSSELGQKRLSENNANVHDGSLVPHQTPTGAVSPNLKGNDTATFANQIFSNIAQNPCSDAENKQIDIVDNAAFLAKLEKHDKQLQIYAQKLKYLDLVFRLNYASISCKPAQFWQALLNDTSSEISQHIFELAQQVTETRIPNELKLVDLNDQRMRKYHKELTVEVATKLDKILSESDRIINEVNTTFNLEIRKVAGRLDQLEADSPSIKWAWKLGYCALEWLLLLVMWFVWLIFFAVRSVTVTTRAITSTVRWLLWC